VLSFSPELGLLPPIPCGFIDENLGLDNFVAKSSFSMSMRADEIVIEGLQGLCSYLVPGLH
jgi:hypothetical protein